MCGRRLPAAWGTPIWANATPQGVAVCLAACLPAQCPPPQRARTWSVTNRIWPPSVLLPASTWPMNTTFRWSRGSCRAGWVVACRRDGVSHLQALHKTVTTTPTSSSSFLYVSVTLDSSTSGRSGMSKAAAGTVALRSLTCSCCTAPAALSAPLSVAGAAVSGAGAADADATAGAGWAASAAARCAVLWPGTNAGAPTRGTNDAAAADSAALGHGGGGAAAATAGSSRDSGDAPLAMSGARPWGTEAERRAARGGTQLSRQDIQMRRAFISIRRSTQSNAHRVMHRQA